jgi:hypothetical protein
MGFSRAQPPPGGALILGASGALSAMKGEKTKSTLIVFTTSLSWNNTGASIAPASVEAHPTNFKRFAALTFFLQASPLSILFFKHNS